MNDLKTKIAEAIGFARPFMTEEQIEAALQAIHDAGYAVVPREATGPMAEVGGVRVHEWAEIESVQDTYDLARRKWTAMIQASQPKTEET